MVIDITYKNWHLKDGVVYPAKDPSIFDELKFPNNDITTAVDGGEEG